MKTKYLKSLLLPIGILFFATASIVTHFIKMPDSANGFFKGFGIGIMLLGIIARKFKPVN